MILVAHLIPPLFNIGLLILFIGAIMKHFNVCHIKTAIKTQALGFNIVFLTSFIGLIYVFIFAFRSYT